MLQLEFPNYTFKIKNSGNGDYIFDEIRKKYIKLTKEEWVRQNCVKFLINEKNFSSVLINIEKTIKINNLSKRYDIVVYKPDGGIKLLVECKSPEIKINQRTFDQIAVYNMNLKSEQLMVTNGLEHYYCEVNYEKKCYTFLKDIKN
ncbi:MAG: type I restriction enzyme HsdR N-terminal domain-containing protein [Flavobacteriaceae bacterium]|nr:type I restriction enzyme HsdR N-terminal domain-containing protein [Flavobacteriaceae bacterium]